MVQADSIQLGQICDLITDQVDPQAQPANLYVGLEHVTPGRFVRSDGDLASSVVSSKFAFKKNDVLYGKLRPYLDKAVLADSDGLSTTELLVLRARKNVDPRFLLCILHSPQFVDFAKAGTTGSQHPRTSWQHISKFEFPDYSFSEQMALSDLLWKLHSLLLTCDSALACNSELKLAAMRELFSRGLSNQPQKESDLGLIPENWGVVHLGDLGKIGNGSTPKKTVPEYWNGGTYPWLTSAKVYDREIVAADQFVTQRALDECHLPRIQPGAVLIAITGQGKTLGHCAVLRTEASTNQHIAYLQTDTKRADPSFIRGYLETQYDYLRQVASGGGSTKGALTCAFLRNLPVPLPATVKEQQDIVTILDTIDRKMALHHRKLTVLDELIKAILSNSIMAQIPITNLHNYGLRQAATEVSV